MLKQYLIDKVADEADWRGSEDLSTLAVSLGDIADDDLLWQGYACVCAAENGILLSERESVELEAIRLQLAAPDGRTFLRDLVRAAAREEL
jgi:hypothetical protein